MSRRVTAVAVGLGAMGSQAAAESATAGLELVAAVDPARAGQDLDGLEILSEIEALDEVQGDVALLATSSRVSDIAGQIELLLSLGFNVVSTSEQLSFPPLHGEVSERIDSAARTAGLTVIGSGVNPGFLMDVMPAVLSTATLRPTSVRVRRHADLTRRRQQLRDKVGVGLRESEWDGESHGHYGLVESAHLCAIALDWQVEAVKFSRDPLTSAGRIEGIREHAWLTSVEGHLIDLELIFQMGMAEEDSIQIEGEPPLRLVFPDGVAGDHATVARLLSCAKTAPGMPAGLRLPIEAPAWLGAGSALR